jgi:hypothetical protein
MTEELEGQPVAEDVRRKREESSRESRMGRTGFPPRLDATACSSSTLAAGQAWEDGHEDVGDTRDDGPREASRGKNKERPRSAAAWELTVSNEEKVTGAEHEERSDGWRKEGAEKGQPETLEWRARDGRGKGKGESVPEMTELMQLPMAEMMLPIAVEEYGLSEQGKGS